MWSRGLFLAALLAIATAARAGSDAVPPEAVLGGVLSVVAGDWNGDGEVDRAVLWQPLPDEPAADLYVFLSGDGPQPPTSPAASTSARPRDGATASASRSNRARRGSIAGTVRGFPCPAAPTDPGRLGAWQASWCKPKTWGGCACSP